MPKRIDMKQVVKFIVGGALAIFAIVGLSIAARYGTGSHYQGGIALFLFLVAVIFYQISTTNFGGREEDR
jgi:hypothetical protein